FLAGNDKAADTSSSQALAALRDKVRAEQNLIIIFGSELRGADIASLVKFGSSLTGAKYICLGDYANSRGAADMGLYPDLLPGYASMNQGQRFADEWKSEFPSEPGMSIQDML